MLLGRRVRLGEVGRTSRALRARTACRPPRGLQSLVCVHERFVAYARTRSIASADRLPIPACLMRLGSIA